MLRHSGSARGKRTVGAAAAEAVCAGRKRLRAARTRSALVCLCQRDTSLPLVLAYQRYIIDLHSETAEQTCFRQDWRQRRLDEGQELQSGEHARGAGGGAAVRARVGKAAVTALHEQLMCGVEYIRY
jgi:hypothetical protein